MRTASPASRPFARLISGLLLTLAVAWPTPTTAILLDRGPDMVYDTVLDITWVRDANLCETLEDCFIFSVKFWSDANAWAEALDFGGFIDWRLPYGSVAAGAGPVTIDDVINCASATTTEEQCRDNEMGYMFYYNMDGVFGADKTGTQTVDGEQLTGIERGGYWSGTELVDDRAVGFDFFQGPLLIFTQLSQLHMWPVRDGDVCGTRPELCNAAAVPEPATLALLGIGLVGLALRRRKHAA